MSLSHRGVGSQSFDRTQREARQAVIRTAGGLTIRGTVYLVPNTRFTDLLERDTESFIAVTSATVHMAGGVEEHAPFLAVNKTQIVTLEEVGPAMDETALAEKAAEATAPR